jgi:hypothetical protein
MGGLVGTGVTSPSGTWAGRSLSIHMDGACGVTTGESSEDTLNACHSFMTTSFRMAIQLHRQCGEMTRVLRGRDHLWDHLSVNDSV